MAARISKSDFAAMSGKSGRGRYVVAPKSSRTLDGVVFDSKGEMNRYAALRLEEKAGAISHLERQPKFPVLINGHPFTTYTGDFAYFRDGQWVVEDFKSKATARDKAYRLRAKAAELFHSIKVLETGV